jgi:hypothetical protein
LKRGLAAVRPRLARGTGICSVELSVGWVTVNSSEPPPLTLQFASVGKSAVA